MPWLPYLPRWQYPLGPAGMGARNHWAGSLDQSTISLYLCRYRSSLPLKTPILYLETPITPITKEKAIEPAPTTPDNSERAEINPEKGKREKEEEKAFSNPLSPYQLSFEESTVKWLVVVTCSPKIMIGAQKPGRPYQYKP